MTPAARALREMRKAEPPVPLVFGDEIPRETLSTFRMLQARVDGSESWEEITIAIEWRYLIRQLGRLAILNRTGRTQTLGGAIKVRHNRPKPEGGA